MENTQAINSLLNEIKDLDTLIEICNYNGDGNYFFDSKTSFDKQLAFLTNIGVKLPSGLCSVKDYAKMRTNSSKSGNLFSKYITTSNLSNIENQKVYNDIGGKIYYNLHGMSFFCHVITRHACLYLKNKEPLIIKDSPFITDFISSNPEYLAEQAVKSHKKGEYFSTKDSELYDKFYEQARLDGVKEPKNREAIIISEQFYKNNLYLIKKDSTLTEFLFGEYKDKYFNIGNLFEIEFYPVADFELKSKKTTITYLCLPRIDVGLRLEGNNNLLRYHPSTFAILKNNAHFQ